MNRKQDSALILPFTVEEYSDVYALWQSCAGVGLSSADGRQSIASYLQRNPEMSFVAKVSEEIVGAILCGHDGRRGFIHHLAVHEDYRRRGLGRRLVKESLDRLQREGIQKCHLLIFHENLSGINFWQNAGWMYREDIGIMSTYIEEGSK